LVVPLFALDAKLDVAGGFCHQADCGSVPRRGAGLTTAAAVC
jgi:hypothetical protein